MHDVVPLQPHEFMDIQQELWRSAKGNVVDCEPSVKEVLRKYSPFFSARQNVARYSIGEPNVSRGNVHHLRT
jgi:hypothetical protein